MNIIFYVSKNYGICWYLQHRPNLAGFDPKTIKSILYFNRKMA